jgi:hypothetical protein
MAAADAAICLLVLGRAVAQAVTRRLPTAAVRVQSQFKSFWICGGLSGSGAGFLQALRFHLTFRIPPIAPKSSINRGWYNRATSG